MLQSHFASREIDGESRSASREIDGESRSASREIDGEFRSASRERWRICKEKQGTRVSASTKVLEKREQLQKGTN